MAEAEHLWYVMCYEDTQDGPQLRENYGDLTAEEPPLPEVVLIPCDLGSEEPAERLIGELLAQEEEEEEEEEPPPVIVVLFDTRGTASSTDVQSCVQRLRQAGAYEAIFHAQGGKEPEAIRPRIKGELKRFHEEQGRFMAQFSRYAFLDAVHNLPGFPPMETSAMTLPCVGAHIGPYTIVGRLGRGEVFTAHNTETRRTEAVKAIEKSCCSSTRSVRRIWNEITALRSVTHPNVVALRAVLHHRDFIYIAMDVAGRSNLARAMAESGGSLELSRARRFLRQIAAAVCYCHGVDVSHGNLTAKSIMVDGQHVKLVDFGSGGSCELSQEICGTVPFMAPEIMAGKAYAPPAADVFACGVLLFEMLCGFGAMLQLLEWSGHVAVPDKQRAKQYKTVVASQESLLLRSEQSLQLTPPEDLVALFACALEPSPSMRWTSAELASCQWLQKQKGQA